MTGQRKVGLTGQWVKIGLNTFLAAILSQKDQPSLVSLPLQYAELYLGDWKIFTNISSIGRRQNTVTYDMLKKYLSHHLTRSCNLTK